MYICECIVNDDLRFGHISHFRGFNILYVLKLVQIGHDFGNYVYKTQPHPLMAQAAFIGVTIQTKIFLWDPFSCVKLSIEQYSMGNFIVWVT